MSFQHVASLSELADGSAIRATVSGIEIGLFRVGDAVFAMENRCPHADAPLHLGTLEGCIVRCWAHGWAFDVRTGFRPEDADGFPIPCFPVRLEGDAIWVDLDQPLNLSRRRS